MLFLDFDVDLYTIKFDLIAEVAEQADARDSKSRDRDIVSVRLRSSAPHNIAFRVVLSRFPGGVFYGM